MVVVLAVLVVLVVVLVLSKLTFRPCFAGRKRPVDRFREGVH